MKKGILGSPVVTQVGILVHDIEKTAQFYADFLGVTKPNIVTTDPLDKSKARYKGGPTRARSKLAFFKIGQGLELELIQPDDEPSTWREDLNRKGEGVHHIAFEIRGMKEKLADLQKENMPLLQTGEYTDGRYAYVDATKDLKVIIELLEND
ncbi:MAG: VOC family protein [Spirochaetia bacterium]|jgi:catechol 2,3-dioxygenase-like lactoylglutathione lyase family enzyme